MVQVREFTDGFDLYPSDQNAVGYGLLATWSGSVAGIRAGRFAGSQAIWMEFNRQLIRGFTPSTDICFGFAMKRINNIGSQSGPIWTLRSSSGNEQFTLSYSLDFRLQLRIGGSGGTIVAETPLPAFLALTWHYFQVAYTLADSGGICDVYVDRSDTPILSFAGDTKGHADANVGQLSLRVGDNFQHDFDDVYLESGGHVLIGEGRMDLRPANADVSNTGFTPSTGATIFGVIDEVPANITDYASATPAASVFRVGFSNLAVNPQTIFGVQIENLSQKDEAGTRLGRNKLWSGATLFDGAILPMQLNSFTFKRDWLKLNPDGAIPWVAASVNAVEGGFEITT